MTLRKVDDLEKNCALENIFESVKGAGFGEIGKKSTVAELTQARRTSPNPSQEYGRGRGLQLTTTTVGLAYNVT